MIPAAELLETGLTLLDRGHYNIWGSRHSA